MTDISARTCCTSTTTRALARLVEKTLAGARLSSVELASVGRRGFDAAAIRGSSTSSHSTITCRARPVWKCCQRIRAATRTPRRSIYVTGSEDSRVAVAALKAGAVDYVWKDVQGHFRELLAEAVVIALEQERLRRDKEAGRAAR